MFELEKAIADWRAEMSRAGIRNQEALDELESHLREQVDRLKPELGDAAAFQAAARQLGGPKQLKQEFSKMNRIWFPRNNPIGLNILGLGFVLMGLDSLFSYMRLAFLAGSHHDFNSMKIYLPLLFVFGLPFAIGIGLLRRSNFWRYCGLIVAALGIVFGFLDLATKLFASRAPHSAFDEFLIMGIAFPARYVWTTDLLSLVFMLWSFVYLSKSAARNLFRAGAKTATA